MRRLMFAFATSAVCFGLLVAVRMVRGDDVIDNAIFAHQRLRELYNAVRSYTNNNEEYLDDPLHLFEAEDLTPESFWHPGDNDPAPATIDNSVPNAPNSAQISFVFRTGLIEELPPDAFLIWDASPDNNDGRFISVAMMDGAVETIPPGMVPIPTNVSLTQSHLYRLVVALHVYLDNHAGQYPDSLLDLYPTYGASWPRSYWNPGDSDPAPTDITNDTPNAINSANISFDFPAAGKFEYELQPGEVILRDNSASNNQGIGINVLRYRPPPSNVDRVEFILAGTAGDADDDGAIDLADWAKLQRCYTGWATENVISDDTCRTLDFNGDNHIDLDDHAQFIEAMTGP